MAFERLRLSYEFRGKTIHEAVLIDGRASGSGILSCDFQDILEQGAIEGHYQTSFQRAASGRDRAGLAIADPHAIANVKIEGGGEYLRWPDLDVDNSVPILLVAKKRQPRRRPPAPVDAVTRWAGKETWHDDVLAS